MDGREVNDLPRTALSYYARVGHAFGAFLHTEVPWGLRARPLPFYKVLFANWYTAPRIRDAFEGQESLCEAASRLEKAAGNVIEAMLD